MASGSLDPEQLRQTLGIYDPTAESSYVHRFERELARIAVERIDHQRAFALIQATDLVFVCEYHPLDSAARTAEEILRAWGEPCLLGLEFLYARDQNALDAYQEGRIGQREFKRRVRYAEEWGYDWPSLKRLLATARRLGVQVRGLDIPPRGGSADLELRDRIAATRLAEWGAGRPGCRAVVLYGEAHLASSHLPRQLTRRAGAGRGRWLRVFHDPEREDLASRGWYASGREVLFRQSRRPGARLRALAEVYHSWAEDFVEEGEIDLPLAVHGVIEAEARALGIDSRRARIGPAQWLADRQPEVYGPREPARSRRRLREAGCSPSQARGWLSQAAAAGACYVPEANVMLAGRAGIRPLALESGRFLALAMRPQRTSGSFWESLAIEALAFAMAIVVDPSLEEASGWERGLIHRVGSGRKAQVFGSWLGRLLADGLAGGRIDKKEFRRWLRVDLGSPAKAVALLRVMTRKAGRFDGTK